MDTAEPWQGDWEKNVRVECADGGGQDQLQEEDLSLILSSTVADCLWSGFSEWSSCSSSCGSGFQRRERKILQPARNEGLECAGQGKEERTCKLEACPGES